MDHGLYAGSQFCIGSIVGDFLLYINNVKFCVLKRIMKNCFVTKLAVICNLNMGDDVRTPSLSP